MRHGSLVKCLELVSGSFELVSDLKLSLLSCQLVSWLVVSGSMELVSLSSRGVKRHNRNKSVLYLKYFPNCLTQNNNGFLYSLSQIKIATKLSGL